MKKYINTACLLIIALFFILSGTPQQASAATIYLEASRNTISVGDTAIIAVKINADGAVLNAIDGEIALSQTLGDGKIQEVTLANSSFGLWPRTPSLSADGHTISFTGGVAGGFSIEGATMFKIVIEATKQGTITIKPQNMSVYLNDGKGTKVPAQLKDIVLTVTAKKSGVQVVNDWSAIVSTDVTPPAPFIIVGGQDASLFEGKKFVYFSAVDNQTGIDHYDVSENGTQVVRSGSTYVLQDQSGKAVLNVVAYDKAGNKISASYPSTSTAGINWVLVIVTVLVLIVLYFIATKIYKKWKGNKNVKTSL